MMDAQTTQNAVELAPTAFHYWLPGAGLLGAVTRVCLLRGRGEVMNMYQVSATLISGTVFAATGSGLAAMFVPGLGSVSLGLSAYIAGMVGMVLAEYVVSKKMPEVK